MTNQNKSFDEFDYADCKAYQKRLLIRVLEIKLAKNGELKPADITEAYEQCNALFHQDIEFLARKKCLLRNPGEHKVDPSRCCLTQLEDAVDLQRDAMELVNRIKPFVVDMICGQSKYKRLQVQDLWRNIFKRKFQCLQIRSGDVSTFPRLFQALLEEMTTVDEEMSRENAKLKPVFESFLRELGPKIDLKLKKYYNHQTLGYEQCPFCNSPWVQTSNELERDFLDVPSFKTPQQLERFFAWSFRKTFYQELVEFVKTMDLS